MEYSGERSEYDLEYRAKDDDAWYSVRVVLGGDGGETMTVSYEGYTDAFDAKFVAGEFKSKEDVKEFVRRFRTVSPQLQDSECGSIKEGMIVCAACNAFSKDDMLFYDAVVEAVHKVNHSFPNGEEQCLCTFLLSWLHGPKKGYFNTTGIEGICTIKGTAEIDPRITSFSKLANKKLRKSSCKSNSTSKHDMLETKELFCDNGGDYLSSIQKTISYFEGINSAKNMVDMRCTTEATDYSRHWDHDKDLGGQHSNYHLMIIENLERNLLPSSFRDFIHEHTSVWSQAYIFPCPSYMPYSRGIIAVDCEKKLQKIFQFLENPAHLIVSSKGRPLVVTERDLRHSMIMAWLGSLVHISQDGCQAKSICQELMLVHSGTEAYNRATQVRKLFLEFTSHQQRLYKTLAREEMSILQAKQSFVDS